MDHRARDGSAKFRRRCSLPLTGSNVVDLLITDLAVFERPSRTEPFALRELAPGVTQEEVRLHSEAEYQ